ncbi:MAG: protoglobin domain-containing protein [Planctomycetaceae bacterium]
MAFDLRVDELFERYQDIQRYVGWTQADAERVRAAAPLVESSFIELIDDFYREIAEHEATRKVITGGDAQVERLKGTLRAWLRDLVTGPYDMAFAERRFRVGYRHVEIGLKQIYVEAAVSRLRNGLLRVLQQNWPTSGDAHELAATMRSLSTLLDLDLAIIQDAYETATNDRMMRSERLAAIGRVAGGVAHELRNPLNVMRTSVYFLRNAKNAVPEKIAEHLERIERQVAASDSVISALSEFAKLPSANLQPMSVLTCMKQSAPLDSWPENVELIFQIPVSLYALADERQMAIVFGNLIRNGCDAMPLGGRLTLSARLAQGTVEVSVTDTGCGISAEDLPRIREPFRSTKARGIGLGLALSQAILEKNHGTLKVISEVGHGSTFTVVLMAGG